MLVEQMIKIQIIKSNFNIVSLQNKKINNQAIINQFKFRKYLSGKLVGIKIYEQQKIEDTSPVLTKDIHL